LAGVVRPVALIERARVAVGGACRPRRTLGVRRTVGAVPWAVLGRIALARRGAAHRARGLEGVGRADRARAGAARVHVAHPPPRRRPATLPAALPRLLAVVARPVALVAPARVAVGGARRPRRTLGVRRTVGPGPRAVLRRVALARRGAADRARGLEGVRRAD